MADIRAESHRGREFFGSSSFCPSLPFHHLPNSMLYTLIHCFVYVHRCFWDRHHEHHPSWCFSCSILLRPHHEERPLISHGHLCSPRRHLWRSIVRRLVFPTYSEQTLWRATSLVIAVIPLIVAPIDFLLATRIRIRDIDSCEKLERTFDF